MDAPFQIRPIGPDDRDACGRVYFDAVRDGTGRHYSAEEARAWAPTDDPSEWGERLYTGVSWVAEGDGRVQGFLTMRHDGHLDLFFVRPGWRRAGVAGALYDAALAWARARGLATLTTQASLLARSFLARRGWEVVAEETALRNGLPLTRYEMALHGLGE